MDEKKKLTYTIGELAKAAGTTPRTVRYYQAEGLLPEAGMRGRYTVYDQTHLDRLRVIQQLKRAYLPLAAIRAQIERLTPEQIHLLVAHDVHVLPEDAAEASRYVAELLELRNPAPDTGVIKQPKVLLVGGRSPVEPGGMSEKPEVWERHRIAEGVELNILQGTVIPKDLAETVRAVREIFEETKAGSD